MDIQYQWSVSDGYRILKSQLGHLVVLQTRKEQQRLPQSLRSCTILWGWHTIKHGVTGEVGCMPLECRAAFACVCPHIYSIFSSEILILLAKWGNVCKVGTFFWTPQFQRTVWGFRLKVKIRTRFRGVRVRRVCLYGYLTRILNIPPQWISCTSSPL